MPLVSLGRRVSTSMAIARNVLTSDTASAPASSAARANDATSVTFGVSLGISGSRVALRTAATTSCAAGRLQPNWMPPSLMFGHEMFSSMAATPSASERMRDTSAYSSIVAAADVDHHDRAERAQLGQRLLDEAVDADALQADRVEHAGRRLDDPRRRVALALGQEQALDADGAERREIDRRAVLDAVAEAAARGDQRVFQRQRSDATDRSGPVARPDDRAIRARSMREPLPGERRAAEGRAGEARADEVRRASRLDDRHHAAVAAAHAAAHRLLERHLDVVAVAAGAARRRRASSASDRRRRSTTGAGRVGGRAS